MSDQLPTVGSRWVWEIDEPLNCAVIEVIETKWNDEEWWVKTRQLLGTKALYSTEVDRESECWNEVGRFIEACSPIGSPVPEQPVEPAPPNRWAGFTDDELDVLSESIILGPGLWPSAWDIGLALRSSLEAERKRRRTA